jgi:hypothetical protein
VLSKMLRVSACLTTFLQLVMVFRRKYTWRQGGREGVTQGGEYSVQLEGWVMLAG